MPVNKQHGADAGGNQSMGQSTAGSGARVLACASVSGVVLEHPHPIASTRWLDHSKDTAVFRMACSPVWASQADTLPFAFLGAFFLCRKLQRTLSVESQCPIDGSSGPVPFQTHTFLQGFVSTSQNFDSE